MFTFSKNNLSDIARFSRDMMRHFVYFVTSDKQTHTMNVDDYNDSTKNYDFLSNREYKDDSGLVIETDLSTINNFGVSDVNIDSISMISGNVRYYEGNKKYNVVFRIETSSVFVVDGLYLDETSNIYMKCISNSELNFWIFELIGFTNEDNVVSIINEEYDFSTTTKIAYVEGGATATFNGLDTIKIPAYTTKYNVSDYIRVFDGDDIKFEAKIIKSIVVGDDLLLHLDRYISDVIEAYTMIVYEFVSLSSPKLTSKNYVTLPTMNYLNRYINDNSRIIDLIGNDLMLTPGVLKTLFNGNQEESTEILIQNDRYKKIYTNGDSIADGFYIISFKYDKIVNKKDIQFMVRIRLEDDVVPGFERIGGVEIQNKTVVSYFADIEHRNSKIDIYKSYAYNSGHIKNGCVVNYVEVEKSDSIENIRDLINANANNLTSFSRQDIKSIIVDMKLNNIIYDMFTINGEVCFNVIKRDAKDNLEFIRVCQDDLILFNSFSIIYKVH